MNEPLENAHYAWKEVCQVCGEKLYVRLDCRDPDIAQDKLEQIRSTIKYAFERAYGIYKPIEPAKEQEEKA